MKTYMKIKMMLAAPLLLGGLAACADNGMDNGWMPGSTYQLDTLNHTVAKGSPFTKALAANYRVFAQDERDEYDWGAQQTFATKGLLAAGGQVPRPEELSAWPVTDAAAAGQLARAHSNLVAMLNSSAPTSHPEWSASAQTNFDCWLHEEYEGWEFDKIAKCRADYMTAMKQINAPVPVAAPAPVPAPAPAATPAIISPKSYLVFFDFDKSDLTPEVRQIIADAAKDGSLGRASTINVVGYTDTSGSPAYNQALSLRRAESVKQELINEGVDGGDIIVDGKGENDLFLDTLDGVREPQNRRATIEVITK